MPQRIVVAQPTGLQLSNLAPPLTVEFAKAESPQSIAGELGDDHGTNPDPRVVANGIGQDVNGAQRDAVASNTVGQSVPPDADKIPPSGADFNRASVDALPGGALPLSLLGQEKQATHISDVDNTASRHVAQTLALSPTITIPSPGGPSTTVFEAGLGLRNGEPPGTHAGQPSFPITTRAGAISFTSPDGVQSVSLGGHTLSSTAQTFPDGTTGSLTASFTFNAVTGKGTISYTYTLLDNTLGIPNASFAVVVTDRDGHSNPPGNLIISIADDVPVARADTDAITPGQMTPETGNVLDGTGTISGAADVQGADGGMSVVGVAKGNGPGGSAPGTVGVAVAGAHGTLTIDAQGHYSYVHTAGGGSDVFTYTIRDTDGSLAHATLTINLGNSAPGSISIPPEGVAGSGTLADEAGLATGSKAAATSEATTGVITFTSPDGVSKIELGNFVLDPAHQSQTFVDPAGLYTLLASYSIDQAGAGRIDYTYTLLHSINHLTAPASTSLLVAVTDADGDRTPGGNLVIDIKDDKPIAQADTDHLTATDLSTDGNVLDGTGTTSVPPGADVLGADGARAAGAVVGIAFGSNVGTVGVGLAGAHGTLTIDAQGHYSYARTSSGTDTFTYTIQDGDGSQATSTLTITVDNATPGNIVIPQPGVAGAGTLADEAGLATGSNPAATSETTTGTITFTSPDGVSKIELGGFPALTQPGAANAQTLVDPAGLYTLTAFYTFTAATGQGTITYTYTLLHNTDNVNGPTSTSLPVAVTDADGDRTPGGNLVIDIKDDKPTANADTDRLTATDLSTDGNVLDATGTTTVSPGVDVLGADGARAAGAVVGIAFGSNVGTVGVGLAGAHGTLTIDAQGHYSYARTSSGTDTFTYTIQDGDGSQATSTLTITVDNATPGVLTFPTALTSGVTEVFEAGLLASRAPGESAGSDAGNPDGNAPTKATGSITFTSLDEVGSITLVDAASNPIISLDSGHQSQTFVDPAGLYTLLASYTIVNGAGTISYTYTLADNTSGNPSSARFTVTVADSNGDPTSGDLVIAIQDDTPTANADTAHLTATDSSASGTVLTNDVLGADGAAQGGAVVGIAAGPDTGNPVNGGVGAQIQGAHGTLTIDAQGHYSYTRTSSGTDTFTYTIQDGDGSLSTATLTITVDNALPGVLTFPTALTSGVTEVFEAGLLASRGVGESAGSDAGNPDGNAPTRATGSITFTSLDGVGSITLVDAASNPIISLDSNHQSQTFVDPAGLYTLLASYTIVNGAGTISYTYTLADNTSGNPSSARFTVTVADTNGDPTGGDLVIAIQDDTPTANADTDLVAAGQTAAETGNVLDGTGTTSSGVDVLGADSAAQGGAVVGVAFGSNVGAVGSPIQGAFGTLTIDAQGHYSYTRDIGVPGGDDHNDVFTYAIADGDGSLSTSTLTIAVANSSPGGISVPETNRGETTVFEAGLAERTIAGIKEQAGSNPAAPTTTDTGTISFTSLDGVKSVELGGLTLTLDPQQSSGSVTDATGRLTASLSYDATTGLGEVVYSYTLLDNMLGNPIVNNGDTTVSFAVAVTDLDNERTQGDDLVITIVNDAPFALSDTDAVIAGQLTPETGNVLTGEDTTSGDSGIDVQGADGATVVNVAIGGTVKAVDPTLGAAIAGAHGTLTIDAQGHYSYARTGGSGADIFTYTIQDGDGNQSSTELAITIGDSAPSNIVIPQTGGADTTVFEAGLLASRGPGESAGSDAGNPDGKAPTTTQTGVITFTSPDGVAQVELGGQVVTATTAQTAQTIPDGTTGQLSAWFTYDPTTGTGEIHYRYTLLDNVPGPPPPNQDTTRSFSVAVTDLDNERTQGGDLVITVKDDKPIANADNDVVVAGQTTPETGNVLDGTGTTAGIADVLGADGAAQGGAVVGIAFGSNTGTVGVGLAGTHGTLTMGADGHYSYTRASSGTDTFTYTIADGDGSQATATLTIAVVDSSPGGVNIPAPGGADTMVFEAGLGTRPGEPAGSHNGDPLPLIPPTITSGLINFISPDGVQKVELGGLVLTEAVTPQTITDATGSLTAHYVYDSLTGTGGIVYTYRLLDNTPSDPSSVSFAVTVTDLDLDPSPPANLTITIVDDSPTAHPDTDFVRRTEFETDGNVITSVGTTSGPAGADVQGADGVTVVGIALGDTGQNHVGGVLVNGNFEVEGTLGTLTLQEDGFYTYVVDVPNAPGGTDVFTYTLRDADGDLSHATLGITVATGAGGPGFAATAGSLLVNDSGTGSDTLLGSAPTQAGNDALTGGSGANHFVFNAPSEGGAHILDFKHGADSIDVLLDGFAGLSGKGVVASSDFVVSNNASGVDLGAAHFAYNASNGQLFYDNNGGDTSAASRILLAVLDSHAALAATDIHKV